MTPAISQTQSPYSRYSTELPVINESLSSILHMAENSACAQVCKRISTFWKSDQCAVARRSTLQADFYKKLKIQPNLIPAYLKCKLTPEMIRTIIDGNLIIQTRKPESLFQTHVMLNNIQNFETQNDWVSSYLLAHTLSMERAGQFICIQEPMSYTYAIMSNLPFSSWLPVLQDPQKANCLIHRFQESLPSFNLNFEGKATCASSVFNWYHAERENQYTQRHCLAILVDLSKEPEGKAAVLAAGGLKFLITVLKDVFERKKYSADIQILQHTIELIHAIAPLPPLSGSETMVIVVKVLHSIITTWAIFQSQNTTEPKVQDLETMTVQALQMLDTFPEASYAPSSEGECSSVPPTISEKTPRPPTTSLEAPQKPSESCDACCRIA